MVKKKRIIFKLCEFPHLSETFIIAQMVTAIKLGYEVQILVQKIIEMDLNLRSSLIDEYGLFDKIIIEDYKIPQNKIERFFKWICLLVFNTQHFITILNYHKEQSKFSLTWLFQWVFYKQFEGVDIFHVQYGTNSNPLSVLKKIGYKPALLVAFHGHDAFFPINGFISNSGYYDNLFKYANLITANTPYLGNKILKLGCPSQLLEMIPVGVDTDFFYSNKLKRSDEILKLITIGRLDKVKGQVNCIEAVYQLMNKGVCVTLTIIGEGEERKNLENSITKYQLEDKVFLVGKKSQFEIRQALWEHDIYLHMGIPSVSGLKETQGLATLEAQACGLPAIVFDTGGVKYTVDEGVSGFICKEFDVEAVVKKVEFLAQNRNMIDKMGENAVIFVNKAYSQKIINKRWGIIYNEVIRNG